MIRDITVGQYYQAKSPVHGLDARVKLVGTLVYVISLFCFSSFVGYIPAIGFFVLVAVLSKVPFSFMVRGLKPILFMLVFTALLNLFWTPGKAFLEIWAITLTWEGLEKAVFISLRLVLLILGSSLMTLTTTPNQLTDGLESLLRPLNHIHVPVHELAMMMSIALRFIPILLEETDRIMKAQAARGADFETGNIIQKLRNMLPILVPLFAAAIRRAGDLALAMDARCYHGGANRTKLHPLKYSRRDGIAGMALVGYIVVLAVLVRL